MNTENSKLSSQGFENYSPLPEDKNSSIIKPSIADVSPLNKRPPLPMRYEDTYGGNDRIGSFDQGRQASSFSTNSFNMPSFQQYDNVDYMSGYGGSSNSMTFADNRNNSFGLFKAGNNNGRRAMFVSENGDFNSYDTGRFSLSNTDFFSNKSYCLDSCASQDFSFGPNQQFDSSLDYPSCSNFGDDQFSLRSPLHEDFNDNFLYSSGKNNPLSSEQTVLRNDLPPLPPRNYIPTNEPSLTTSPFSSQFSLSEAYPSSSSSYRYYHSMDGGYPLSPSSSVRSSVPQYNHNWNRGIPEVNADPVREYRRSMTGSSQLTANAPPFTSQSMKYPKEEGGKDNNTALGGEAKVEKRKGSGEDVNINKLLSGEETRSAVMIRNIPNRFSKEELCEILDPLVKGRYTILNMPLDSKTHRNLGYSFIQFTTIKDLITAYQGLQGKTWPNSESVKRCRFCYAKIQGDPNSTTVENGEVVKEE